jgi:hypothetical protein
VVEESAQLVDLAISGRPLEDFLNHRSEIVQGSDGWKGCREGVVFDTARAGEDERVIDGVERNSAIEELSREDAIGGSDYPEHGGSIRI